MYRADSLPQLPPKALRPFASIGRAVLDVVHYLGGMGLLGLSALRAVVRPRGESPPLAPAVARHLDRIFRYGLPLVAIIHVGLGSFLAMQAYFGATFMDGIGPVVGVGMVRNIGPLMSAMVLAGLVAALYTTELRGLDRDILDRDPSWLPDREVLAHPEANRLTAVEPARLAASRMIAAVIAGPVLGVWGALVGIAVGYFVASDLLNTRGPAFWGMFFEMLWARDVSGVILKGLLFGFSVSWFACWEGLHHGEGPANNRLDTPFIAVRAACLGGCAVLLGNSAWFLLFYHAGPAFGPTLLAPPLS
jgi:phospholipid/cholesterol/gamma-HCH transport system permease protein